VIREAARSFFILRSNKWKESDESQTGNLWKEVVGLGGRYNFGPTVPNQRKLREAEPGAELLFDRKEPRGVEFFAVASLKKVTENGHFSAWLLESGFQFYSPSIPVTDEMQQIIETVPKYNRQHSIRPMTQLAFESLRRLIEEWRRRAR